jgi:MoxR-like ATPase
MSNLEQTGEKVLANVERVIVGKHHEVRLALVALLCRGHLLIEDVPGTGKTVLAKAIARSLGCSFRRIQFTPDLLPSDVTGLSIYNQKSQEFEFRPGPIMAQVVLADEINRATPKTQSALLEAMEERQATIDGTTYSMPDPFLVIATQNPIEYEGTFALPQAQLDRFLVRARIGYPSETGEREIASRYRASAEPLAEIEQIADGPRILELRELVRRVHVADEVEAYAVALTRSTREHPDLELGASPRASVALYRAAQAAAVLDGRSFALPDDIKAMAGPVLEHRLVVDLDRAVRGATAAGVVADILAAVPAPPLAAEA